MSSRLRFTAPAVASLVGVLLAPSPSHAQSCGGGWKCGVSYGGSTVMDLYVPTNVDASPGVVVSLHYCSGNSSNAHGWFQSSADKYGFIIIAPSAGGNCFDATPQRSGEREAISKMVQYVITQNHADPKRVFASGASSGACMTYALLAAYPDVFAGGSALAAVPAGAWTGGNAYGWSTPSKTAQQWGDIVRSADSGFSGTRPRVQLWHGQGDTTLTYSQNFPAEVAQWTNVLGVSDANATKSTTKPTGAQDDWNRTSYKDSSGTLVLETNSSVSASVPHDLTGRGLWGDVVRFFGLDQDSGSGGSGTGGSGGGGRSGTGGGAASGGGAAKGGASATGGSSATGGKSGSTGGATNAGSGNGGAVGKGGSSNGGALATGGASNGGALGKGGGSSSGGSSSGGALATGGGTSTGGALGTGGTMSSTGGSTSPGGKASGGTTTIAGGASGAGGSTAGSSGGGTDDGTGCGCRVAGGGEPRSLGALAGLTVALGALLRRRRRTERQD